MSESLDLSYSALVVPVDDHHVDVANDPQLETFLEELKVSCGTNKLRAKVERLDPDHRGIPSAQISIEDDGTEESFGVRADEIEKVLPGGNVVNALLTLLALQKAKGIPIDLSIITSRVRSQVLDRALAHLLSDADTHRDYAFDEIFPRYGYHFPIPGDTMMFTSRHVSAEALMPVIERQRETINDNGLFITPLFDSRVDVRQLVIPSSATAGTLKADLEAFSERSHSGSAVLALNDEEVESRLKREAPKNIDEDSIRKFWNSFVKNIVNMRGKSQLLMNLGIRTFGTVSFFDGDQGPIAVGLPFDKKLQKIMAEPFTRYGALQLSDKNPYKAGRGDCKVAGNIFAPYFRNIMDDSTKAAIAAVVLGDALASLMHFSSHSNLTYFPPELVSNLIDWCLEKAENPNEAVVYKMDD
ncbi:MAG TPA: hypothetical protein VIT68_04240 [Candidatus Gracilibacteria bacterium]